MRYGLVYLYLLINVYLKKYRHSFRLKIISDIACASLLTGNNFFTISTTKIVSHFFYKYLLVFLNIDLDLMNIHITDLLTARLRF